MTQEIQHIFVPPLPPPPPIAPITCGRIATNQFGVEEFLAEPLPGAPGNTGPGSHLWYSDGSSASGIHQKFVYEEELQGEAEVVYSDVVLATTGTIVTGQLVPIEQGDSIVIVAASLGGGFGTAFWQQDAGEQVILSALEVTNGDITTVVGVINNIQAVSGVKNLIVSATGTATAQIFRAFLVRGGAAAGTPATASGVSAAGSVGIAPANNYDLIMSSVATDVAGVTHTPNPDAITQMSYDDHQGLQLSSMRFHPPTTAVQAMAATLSASGPWAAAAVAVPASSGNVLAAHRQYIVMRDMVGTFEAGETLTAIEL